MILGGFTRICVNIHHPALAASFRDVARLKRTEQIRACRLPAPASSSHEVATSAIRRRYVDMDQVSMYLACFPSTVPETAPPSFHGVPRVGSPASTVLWGAATPCHPFRHASFPSLGDTSLASLVRPHRLWTRGRGSSWSCSSGPPSGCW